MVAEKLKGLDEFKTSKSNQSQAFPIPEESCIEEETPVPTLKKSKKSSPSTKKKKKLG